MTFPPDPQNSWRPPAIGKTLVNETQKEDERPPNTSPILRLVVVTLIIAALVTGANWEKICRRFIRAHKPEAVTSRASSRTISANVSLTDAATPSEMQATVASAPPLAQPSQAADVPEKTASPDRRYGVVVPREPEAEGSRGGNQLVNLTANRVLARIDAFTYWEGTQLHMNHAVLNPQWSQDGTELAWIVEGKWSPRAFTLLKIADGNVKWQLDVIPAVQQEILSKTRAGAPENYEAAKKWNAGNGSAFPDGFVVNVETPKDRLSLPLQCRVTLDSNPKGIPTAPTDLRASMNATIRDDRTIVFTDFAIDPGTIKSVSALSAWKAPTPAPPNSASGKWIGTLLSSPRRGGTVSRSDCVVVVDSTGRLKSIRVAGSNWHIISATNQNSRIDCTCLNRSTQDRWQVNFLPNGDKAVLLMQCRRGNELFASAAGNISRIR